MRTILSPEVEAGVFRKGDFSLLMQDALALVNTKFINSDLFAYGDWS